MSLSLPEGVNKILNVRFSEYSITIVGEDENIYVLADSSSITADSLCQNVPIPSGSWINMY